jgi:hypothetical protein
LRQQRRDQRGESGVGVEREVAPHGANTMVV